MQGCCIAGISMAETGADEVLKLMAARNVVYIPTLAVTEANYALNADLFFTSSLRGKVWDVLLDSITHPKSIVKLDVKNRCAYLISQRSERGRRGRWRCHRT